jgi:hypothetical protein
MPGEFCPQCGNARTGQFRFCRTCQFDFDTLGAAPAPVIPSAPPSAPPAAGQVPLAAPIDMGTPPAVLSSQRGLRRIWLALGVVIFVAVIAAAAVVALAGSGSLTPHHTITGTFELLATDQTFPSITVAGSTCRGTGGYADIDTGAQVTLKDGDGKILGTTQLSDGTGSVTSCTFMFSIADVPEVSFYSIEISRRGAVTNSLAQMQANAWTFGLTLGK